MDLKRVHIACLLLNMYIFENNIEEIFNLYPKCNFVITGYITSLVLFSQFYFDIAYMIIRVFIMISANNNNFCLRVTHSETILSTLCDIILICIVLLCYSIVYILLINVMCLLKDGFGFVYTNLYKTIRYKHIRYHFIKRVYLPSYLPY